MPDASPATYQFESRVDPHHDGWRLEDYLTHRFRYLPRELWLSRLANGHITINGVPSGAGETVTTGDTVGYRIDVVEPEVDFSYEVVHSDKDVVVVSKSGNIPVHASGKYVRHTLIARLREDFGERLDLVHRLDRETSGLVVLSRNPEASSALGAAFRDGRVEKRYLAVVRGVPPWDKRDVDTPIRKIGKQHPLPRMVADARGGKPSRTGLRVLERLRDVALVEATPLTGRTNQVRVHLELCGHPVVGDKTYGMPARLLRLMVADPGAHEVRSHLELPRHALHHAAVRFPHPESGSVLSCRSELPADISSFLAERR